MSSLEFEDQNKKFVVNNNNPITKQIFLVKFLLKHKFADSERRANNMVVSFLLAVSIASIIFAVWYVNKANEQKQIRYEISSDVLKLLPEEIQIKILQQ